MPGVRHHKPPRKSRSDPCLDYIRVSLHSSLPPLPGHYHHAAGATALAPRPAPYLVRSVNTTSTFASVGVQTDLSARRLRNIADGRHVTSLAFAKFITGKRVSEYDGAQEGQAEDDDFVREPRGSSADNLSVALSERFIGLERGPVPIMQNPRLTQLVGRQERIARDDAEIPLVDLDAESAAPLLGADQLETTEASALTASPDELPHFVQEVLKYQRELGLAKTADGKLSDGSALPAGVKLPQDQHSTIAELTLDGVGGTSSTAFVGGTQPETGGTAANGLPTNNLALAGKAALQEAPDEVYEEFMTERLHEKESYLKQMHLGSLVELPDEDKPMDLQEDFFTSIVNGVCGKCGRELKHMELTDLFRYKVAHKDEPFLFDPEHFCCEEFQREVERLLFSRGVKKAVRDIRRSQVHMSITAPGATSYVPAAGKEGKGKKKKHGPGHKHTGRDGGRASEDDDGESSGDEMGQLDTIAHLLEKKSDSSSSSSSSEDGEKESENERERKAGAKEMKGKFKSRMRSSQSSSKVKGSGFHGVRTTGTGSGAGEVKSGPRVTKGGSTVTGMDSRGTLMGSSGAPMAGKFREKESSGFVLGQKRSSVSGAQRRNSKATPDELDTRYKGNSMTWSLSSRVCLKTGWTLRRPRSSDAPKTEGLYLSEKLLDVEADYHSRSAQPFKLWPLFPACFVHWPGDAQVAAYTDPPSPTNFYPYLDGGTACVTAEYAPGLSILVVLPKPIRTGSNALPPSPVAAIFDTAAWGAVIDTDWTPNVLLSPKNVKLFGLAADLPDEMEKIVSWKSLGDNIANPHLKSAQQINDEVELDIRGRSEIAFTLKNDAMRVAMNCGFRQSKGAYTSASEDGTKRFLVEHELRHANIMKSFHALEGLMSQAEQIAESVAAGGDNQRSRNHRSRRKKNLQ